jgi:hypothetical protein
MESTRTPPSLVNLLRKRRRRFERQPMHKWRRAGHHEQLAYLRYRVFKAVDKGGETTAGVGVGKYKSECGISGSEKSLHSPFTLVVSTPGVRGRTTGTPTRSTSRQPSTTGVDEMLEAEPFAMPARKQLLLWMTWSAF